MSNGTVIGVAAWVALVAAPIFLQPSSPVSDEAAVRELLEARIRAVADGDEPGVRATAAPDFGGTRIGAASGPGAWTEPYGSLVRPDWASLHFPTGGVATVSGTWKEAGTERHEARTWGLVTYVLRMRHRRWQVTRVTLLQGATGSASVGEARHTGGPP